MGKDPEAVANQRDECKSSRTPFSGMETWIEA